MSDNPKSKIDNPQSFDPALREHLAELAALAREVGAAEVTIIRQPWVARLFIDIGDGYGAKVFDLAYLDEVAAGLLVVLRFPASDGGEAGVEVVS